MHSIPQITHRKHGLQETALLFGSASVRLTGRNVARLIVCPNCAMPMTLAHTHPKYVETPRLNTFACKGCGVSYTEAAAIEGS
jgi:hypothetical protein